MLTTITKVVMGLVLLCAVRILMLKEYFRNDHDQAGCTELVYTVQ